MARIPKKLKQQAKRDIRSTGSKEKMQKTVIKYAFEPGDLVEYDGKHVLILKEEESGWYIIMSDEGQSWGKASKMRKIREI